MIGINTNFTHLQYIHIELHHYKNFPHIGVINYGYILKKEYWNHNKNNEKVNN